jgi:hypothetical protein
LAAVTPKFKLGFRLVSGKPNMRDFQEASTQSFNRGDLVQMSGGKVAQFTTPSDTTKTTTLSAGAIGIAGKDASGTANTWIPVFVISPEQEWAVHGLKGVAASTKATLDEGKNCKVAYSASTAYTLSDGNSNTFTTTVAGWFVKTTAATADGKGVIIAGYPDRAGSRKGGELLVRFGRLMCTGAY